MGFSYEYYFDSHGTTKSSKGNESNEIWIDTGGGISMEHRKKFCKKTS